MTDDGTTSALELVRDFIRALEAKDFARATTMVSDDVEYDNVPMRKMYGPAAITEGLSSFMGAAMRVEWKIHREGVFAHDAAVTVFNERTDIFEFGWGTVSIPVAGVFEISNGKITLWRDYFDLQTFTKQMEQARS